LEFLPKEWPKCHFRSKKHQEKKKILKTGEINPKLRFKEYWRVKLLIFNQQNDLSIETKAVKPLIKQVLSLEKRSTNELAVYFVSTEEISNLHGEFFDDNSPTDCISFPIDQKKSRGYHMLGEVFICPNTAVEYVLKRGEEVNEDCYRETTLYLVHGLLHLLGYDDTKEKDRVKMRETEIRVMQHLILENLLLKPT